MIYLDFDEVLYDLSKASQEFILKEYGKMVSPEEVTHWNYLTDLFPRVRECWSDPKHYSKGGFLPGSIDFVKYLKERYEVRIITASYPEVEAFKDELISSTLDVEVIHSSEKYKYTKGQILIDDGPHNIEAHDGFGIVFDRDGKYGWNRNIQETSKIKRAHSYNEVISILESL